MYRMPGRNDGGQGRHNSLGAESLQGRRITAGRTKWLRGTKKVPTLSQVPASIQYIASERPQVRT